MLIAVQDYMFFIVLYKYHTVLSLLLEYSTDHAPKSTQAKPKVNKT